jgi:DNA repair exonuclease SbcCD nuclease subunit
MNIDFVLHEGDLVNSNTNVAQWVNANDSMSLLDGHVPWAVLPGNHDGTDVGGSSENLIDYNMYFSYSRFSGEAWYGGAYNDVNTNNFVLFSGGKDDYIIFSFQYHPSDAVLAWANATIEAHPDRRAIVVTHDYLNTDGTRTTEGNHIWNSFIIHHADQIFLVLCGHMHGEAKRQDTVGGHIVYQVLADYQDRTNGGDGWLRIIEFHPAEDKIYIKTFSPYKNIYETDADQIFLVLCGHMHGEAKRQDTVGGHIVYQVLADYQDRTNGGDGWLRIIEFHPAEDKIYIKTFSPYKNIYETDADSQFTLYYDMTDPN